MRVLSFFISAIILLLIFSCAKEEKVTPKIVVEGWIEEDKPPIVMLHHTYTFGERDTNLNVLVENQLIMWAKVTIDNNEEEQILIGQLDMDLVPPYKYSTARMIGEVNKEYNITVEYEGEMVTATTKILPKVPIDSIVIKNIQDLNYEIKVHFKDIDNNENNYYILLYKYKGKTQYTACPMGITNSLMAIDGNLHIVANRRIHSLTTDSVGSIFFEKGDSVLFKLCHIDSTTYEVWNSFLAQEVSPNIPITSTTNIKTNINNGVGYWCGMNGTEKFVVVKSNTTYRY